MKKMFFTAVALMAFSATSMANTVEVKEVVIEETKVEEAIVKKSCMEAALDLYEAIQDGWCGSPGCGGDNVQLLNVLTAGCR